MEHLMTEASKKCEEYRLQGYHCSESSMRAVSDVLGLDSPEILYKVSSGFRGGGGGYQDRCGIVATGIVLISYLYGRTSPDRNKEDYSYLIRVLHDRFIENLGSVNCRVLKNFYTRVSPENNCAYVYQKGAEVLAGVLIDADKLIEEMPEEEKNI